MIIKQNYCRPIYGTDKKWTIKLALARQKKRKCG